MGRRPAHPYTGPFGRGRFWNRIVAKGIAAAFRVGSGPPPARSCQALQPQQIELDVDVPDVKRALERAAEVICRAHGLDPAPVFRALWRREQIGSTAIGHGVALPHARISGIAKPLMLFMRPKYAIEFGAPDSRLVTRIWVILVPADGLGTGPSGPPRGDRAGVFGCAPARGSGFGRDRGRCGPRVQRLDATAIGVASRFVRRLGARVTDRPACSDMRYALSSPAWASLPPWPC